MRLKVIRTPLHPCLLYYVTHKHKRIIAYSHALFIPLKSSKSKYEVVHEQKFKDLLSSTCQISVERRVLDLESEAMRGRGSFPTRGNILSLNFFLFSCIKDENANIGISVRM